MTDSGHDVSVVPFHPRHVQLVTGPEKQEVGKGRQYSVVLKIKSVTTRNRRCPAVTRCYVTALVQRVEREVE